jgi:DNA-binding beta-propeller fold protein YncE
MAICCRPCAVALFALYGVWGVASASPDAAPMFAVVADVALPGDTSRFDYESIDTDRHLLFIAHLGASEVLVFDTQARTVLARIGNVSHVHGVLVVPESKRVYASATGTDEVVAIDEDTFDVVARMPGGKYPDGLAYVPALRKLYVSDETGETETVIDTQSNRRVATIGLGGEVGNTQYDAASKHVFVNVQSRNELVEIDPATDRIVRRIALPGAQGNHGLLIDASAHRAFIACEGNDKLLVLDMDTHIVQSAFSVGHGPDVLAEDAGSGSVYVAGESGVVSVFRLRDGQVSRSAEGFLGPNAHVVAIDASRHRAYFPLKSISGRPVLRIVDTAR